MYYIEWHLIGPDLSLFPSNRITEVLHITATASKYNHELNKVSSLVSKSKQNASQLQMLTAFPPTQCSQQPTHCLTIFRGTPF